MLNGEFVAAAIDCGTHQQRQDPPGKFFQKIAEQGHYAGQTEPTETRQGIYIVTPEGELLQSDNTTDARQVTGLIYRALRQWKTGFAEEQRKPVDEHVTLHQDSTPTLPVGGIALLQTMRDLPRTDQASIDAWRHNFDHLWMTKAEAMSFIPTDPKIGTEKTPDPEFTRRFLKFHLVDQVRGSSRPWKDEDIQSSDLKSMIVDFNDNMIRLEVTGTAKINRQPSGEVNPYLNKAITKDRGVDLKIIGKLDFNLQSESFDRFDLIAYGDRWGTDVYSNRQNDLEAAPIGFAFQLAQPTSSEAVPPTFMLWHNYFAEN